MSPMLPAHLIDGPPSRTWCGKADMHAPHRWFRKDATDLGAGRLTPLRCRGSAGPRPAADRHE